MKEFDVLVIGAGPGGYVAAIRAAQLGKKTAIIEKQWLGGVCLNVGCIPSKALLKNAEVAHTLRHRGRDFGFKVENLTLDFAAAVKRSRKVSTRLIRGIAHLMGKNEIEVIMGSARLVAADKVSVTLEDGSVEEIKAADIIIATGSQPFTIPGVEVDGQRVLSYKEAILQESLPESVVIIGGGAIGVEFATVWSSYGAEVAIVEMLPHILPLEDEEVSQELEKAFKRKKIKVLTSHRVESVQDVEDGVEIRVTNEGVEKVLKAEQALMAIGFRPNTSELGLEALGVKVTSRGGFIEIDDHMGTSVPGIWAIGDVTGKLLLAHVASAQGMICAESIAGLQTEPLLYQNMPRATYCSPQVASFGLTEKQAQEEGHHVKVSRFPFLANGKALGLADQGGFVKLLKDVGTGQLLGAHMIGPDVSELLPELTLAAQAGLTTADIARNVHAHPTLSEVLMEAAHDAEGHAVHI